MNNRKSISTWESDEHLAVLQSNVNAIKAISSAVEGTLGPKGLDTMLVDEAGEVIITNDGVTILNKMEVEHPAARMLIQAARSQQQEIGDGTTTATVLASELLTEAVNQVNKGVPIQKLITGIRMGINSAINILRERARPLALEQTVLLKRIAYIAGREHEDIADLIVAAANQIGIEKLLDPAYRLADSILAHEGTVNELLTGLIINKRRMNSQMPARLKDFKILVIQDSLAPEEVDDEALGTELGFSKYLEYKEIFQENLQKIKQLGVNLIAVDRGVDPLAEEFCVDQQIMVLQRLSSREVHLLVESTGAKPIKRTGLHKGVKELSAYLGSGELVSEDEKLQKTRIIAKTEQHLATVLIGASTGEIVAELERIAKDAASSLQAALKGGYVPGGGAIEFAIARELEKQGELTKGFEVFGIQAVAGCLKKPLIQIIINAGYNPLEKTAEVRLAQAEQETDSIAIDADSGQLLNMAAAEVYDPVLVKIHALKAAGEIAIAILRINTIIRMKKADD